MSGQLGSGELVSGGTVAPHLRDLAELEATLERWIADRMPQARDVRITDFTYPKGAGLSHETILFDAAWTEDGAPRNRGMVIRIKPIEHTVYQDDMFVEQYELMRAVHRLGATPVAEPYWIEHDAAVVGAPFFVMEKKLGRVPVSFPPYSREGWVTELSTGQREKLWENAIRALASIQKLPVNEAGFLEPTGRFPDGFDQEWDRWDRFFAWVKEGRELPFLEDIWARLDASKPKARQPGIVWGDSRIGNVMFDADMNVAAVMDWEQPSLGGALHDLAWWTLCARLESTQQGLPRLSGMGSREDTIALWGEASGIDTADIEWYERFAAFKLSCLAVRTAELRGVNRPGMNAIDNPPVRVLAEWYGLESPKP
ncbi:phosphotransferase family protein [Sphingomonas montanisoli]|uniref:Phosphotransferase family protein n=1 Tax=Sphingomonas montanisoli TaxID=2606412 RepID=A0A5D9C6N1_9SPHN|nr:phosphotransferase family protein [Sphingomonas montanisoli]TZG27508.1 phosphotransferase family protein [Sphingomonas montanisoli]